MNCLTSQGSLPYQQMGNLSSLSSTSRIVTQSKQRRVSLHHTLSEAFLNNRMRHETDELKKSILDLYISTAFLMIELSESSSSSFLHTSRNDIKSTGHHHSTSERHNSQISLHLTSTSTSQPTLHPKTNTNKTNNNT